MDSGRVYGGSDMIALLDNSSNSLWIPSSSKSFHETMVNFEQEIHQERRPSSKADCHRVSDGEETGGEELEFHHPEKKRRLTAEQVQLLEKNFDVENKLEPDRKVELAKELGLQSRQVAIWFQNRRARFKTKQLEKDYDSLKASFDCLRDDYESLIKERDYLQNEVKQLTKKLKQRETGRAKLDPDYPLNSDPHHEGIPMMKTHEKITKTEDASSVKSDVFDSEDSAHMKVDPDLQSDFSQDEEDHHLKMSKTLLLTTFNNNNNNNELKVEEVCYDPNGTSCNFSLVDDQPFWSWLY